MGQAGSVPDDYYKARAPGDRVIQNLPLQQTIKFTYANGGYSLSQHNKRGALLVSSTNILIFRSHKLLLDIKFEDPRWKTGGVSGQYESGSNTLLITVSTKEFHQEIEKYLQNEPPSYVEGVMQISIDVELDQMSVDRIFSKTVPADRTLPPTHDT